MNADQVIPQGSLYVVGTPIGNLDDMTYRAIQTLKDVDAIAAEDTRHTGKLLHHFQISTPQISYHQHNIHQRTPQLVERLQNGESIAIVTDAGMPGISDPGCELIQACVEAEITVVPIPGPVAAIAALVASGLPTDRFCFEGFLPAKGKERRDRLAIIAAESRTLVLYESPHRLQATIADLYQSGEGDRLIVIARELTKRFETFWRGTLEEAIALTQDTQPRGEYTLVLMGKPCLIKELNDQELLTLLQEKIEIGLSPSQASRALSKEHKISRRRLYQLTLE
jgi:16S rRNA (cytidine1402-2'-O)-methyltransferase